jgi:hypothetical protein
VFLLIPVLVLVTPSNPALQDEYEFVSNTSRWWMLFRSESFSGGKLDAAGNFCPDRSWIDVEGAISRSPPFNPLNRKDNESVYEFRSGRLIPGVLSMDGNFVPELGGKVIAFKDYTYKPGATRIYNLPGYFKLKAEVKK